MCAIIGFVSSAKIKEKNGLVLEEMLFFTLGQMIMGSSGLQMALSDSDRGD
jgi:hypothetical protein